MSAVWVAGSFAALLGLGLAYGTGAAFIGLALAICAYALAVCDAATK